jgi:ribosomal protein S18 acetylase RimI-like enzyme
MKREGDDAASVAASRGPAWTSERQRFVELSADELRARLDEALGVYVSAMDYAPGTNEQRAPMWLSHMLRAGWRSVAALDDHDRLVGISYGYRGQTGQWWHEQVRRGLAGRGNSNGSAVAERWMVDYYELTELHVLPAMQAGGIGERLLRMLVTGVETAAVLLSTPEGTTRAWRLYRRLGFSDVLRNHHFVGDPRPFAVLGRTLPLE